MFVMDMLLFLMAKCQMSYHVKLHVTDVIFLYVQYIFYIE